MSEDQKRSFLTEEERPGSNFNAAEIDWEQAEPQDELLPEILRRAPTLREAPFWEVRNKNRALKSVHPDQEKMYTNIRTVAITIIICLITYFVAQFY